MTTARYIVATVFDGVSDVGMFLTVETLEREEAPA